jgi:hypothetical protein
MTIEPGTIVFASTLCPFAVDGFYKRQEQAQGLPLLLPKRTRRKNPRAEGDVST